MTGTGTDALAGVPAGTLLWVAALLLAGGCVSAGVPLPGRSARRVRSRARALWEGADPAAGRPAPRRTRKAWPAWARRRELREGAAALGLLAFGAGALGGAVGGLVGLAGAYGVWRWLRTRTGGGERAAGEAEERAAARQLPLAADLLAACLAAGSSPGRAAEAVGGALDGPLGERLTRAATELRLGGEPAAVWGRFGELPGSAGLARCMERAGTTGVPAVEPVTRLAAGLRADRAREGAERARRAAVLVTGPLGLCFLPAFLAVGVAPVVVGLAGALL